MWTPEFFLFDVTLLPFKSLRGKKEGMQLRSLRPETSKEEEKEAGRVREAGSGFRLSTDHSESCDAGGPPGALGLHPELCGPSLSQQLPAAGLQLGRPDPPVHGHGQEQLPPADPWRRARRWLPAADRLQRPDDQVGGCRLRGDNRCDEQAVPLHGLHRQHFWIPSLQPGELPVPAADTGERLRRVPLAAAPLPRQPGPGQARLLAGHQPAPIRAVPVAQERDPAAALRRHRAAPAPHAQRTRRRGPAQRAQAARPRHARARRLLPGAAQRRGLRPCRQRPARGAPRTPPGRARRLRGRRALPAPPRLRLGRPTWESHIVSWGTGSPATPSTGGGVEWRLPLREDRHSLLQGESPFEACGMELLTFLIPPLHAPLGEKVSPPTLLFPLLSSPSVQSLRTKA